MSEKQKKHRLLYSTGGFCTAVGVTALDTNVKEDENYIDHLLLYSVDGNIKFRKMSEEHGNKIHHFETIHHLDDFIDDKRLSTVKKRELAEAFSGIEISEVFTFAESSGTRFDAFYEIFPGASIFVYEEGMLGYCDSLFHNSKHGGLDNISHFFTTNYFGKIFPQALQSHDFKIVKYNNDKLRENLLKGWSEFEMEPSHQASALLMAAPLWRFNKINFEDTIAEHLALTEQLLERGLIVYFKDHPRPENGIYEHVIGRLGDKKAAKVFNVSEKSVIAENIINTLRPSVVVSFGSTALFNSYELYDTPSFVYRTELVPASLNYVKQHVINAALKMRYIPNCSELPSVDSDGETSDAYRRKSKIIFDKNLGKRQGSLEDPIIQRIAKRLNKQGWPRPKSPNEVLDYIFLDDKKISRKYEFFNKPAKKKSDDSKKITYHLLRDLYIKANNILANIVGVRIARATSLDNLIKTSKNDKIEISKRTTIIKQKDAELTQKNAELMQKDAEVKQKDAEVKQKDAEVKLKDAELMQKDAEVKQKDAEQKYLERRWRPWLPIDVMTKSWKPFIRKTSQDEAYKLAAHMTRGMDVVSQKVSRLSIEGAYMARWDPKESHKVKYDVEYLKQQLPLDISAQDNLLKKDIDALALENDVNMGAVRQSLAYASGLYEFEHKIDDRLLNSDFIDGGSYIGDSAYAFLKFKPNRIFCFEPSPENFAILKKNINRAELSNKIIAREVGLSHKKEELFITKGKRAGNYVARDFDPTQSRQSIELTTIDHVVEEENLKVGLIKLDVEGFESQVIDGAIETIKKFHPILLISVYHSPEDFFYMRDKIEEMKLNYKFELRKFSYNPVVETVLICF